MSTVITHAVVSVDGFIADTSDEVGPLFDWYFNGDVPIEGSPGMKVSQASGEYVNGMWASIGVVVMGRHMFDITNGWEASPPAGEHVVVVSHRPRPGDWHPEASHYHFAGDVTQAITKARELAGDRVVAVCAGDVAGQALTLGLVVGSGKRYFGPVDGQQLLEDPDTVIQGDRVLHLRYRVRQPA
jgi:dihydrofolate reductase